MTLDCHGRGREFESRRPRHSFRQCLCGFSSLPAKQNYARKNELVKFPGSEFPREQIGDRDRAEIRIFQYCGYRKPHSAVFNLM